MLRNANWIAPVLIGACFAGCGSGAPSIGDATVAHAQESAPVAVPAASIPTAAPELAPAEPTASPTETTPVDQLKAQLKELAETRTTTPAAVSTVQSPPESLATPGESEVEALRSEVAGLRKDVDRLQETVDAALAYLVGELGAENRKLRTDLAADNDATTQDPLTETEVAAEAPPAPEPLAMPAPQRVDYGEAGYLAIKEWGRTPEQAAELAAAKPGAAVSTLRGMICAISPGLAEDELTAIGKRIRASCDGYDNVNIDIFDDESAARDFAENNVRSSTHLVMNITRHKTSGQDVMVRIHANGTREVIVE